MKHVLPIFRQIPIHIRFLGSIYLAGIVLLTVPRTIILLNHPELAAEVPTTVLMQSFWMGFRFDTVISGYVLALPFVMLTASAFVQESWRKALELISVIIVSLFYLVCLLAASADIPFFQYHNSRLTSDVLAWADTPGFVAAMVLNEPDFYLYFILFAVLAAMFLLFIRYLWRWFQSQPRTAGRYAIKIVFSVLAAVLLFVAIRGRLAAKSPIRWGTAYFSEHSFANNLGLNAMFTFLRSWSDSQKRQNQPLQLMDGDTALIFAAQTLQTDSSLTQISPIARSVSFEGMPAKLNVVLVLMENMAAWKVGALGSSTELTPNLDSLIQSQSYLFSNVYSTGIHTFNGVYSTLFGLPALLRKHPMKSMESMQSFSGIASVLKRHGYQTTFMTTHDGQFDNMAGFMSNNGFDEIITEDDYPDERVLSTLGVPDHYLFEFATARIDQRSQSDMPFFVTLLTASDHGPYIIPEDIDFDTPPGDIKSQIVAYADWSIGRFMRSVRTKEWYKNTVFVFVADHGTNREPVYDISLAYHHVPFVIHAPGIIDSSITLDNLGSQMDVFPTIMNLLKLPYINNTLGINLLQEAHQFVFFNADHKIGCLSDDYLWVYQQGRQTLHKYRERDPADYVSEFPAIADSMRTHTFSMYQSVQELIRRRQAGLP